MQAPKKLATYEDLLALPEDVRAEVIGGVLVTPPPPLPRHGRRAQLALGRAVGGPLDADDGRGGPGGWWIVAEVDVRFTPHDIVVRKRRLYAEHGVPFYWLLDPGARTLEALRLEPSTKTWIEVGSYDDDSIDRIAPFEAVALELTQLFPPRQQEVKP